MQKLWKFILTFFFYCKNSVKATLLLLNVFTENFSCDKNEMNKNKEIPIKRLFYVKPSTCNFSAKLLSRNFRHFKKKVKICVCTYYWPLRR